MNNEYLNHITYNYYVWHTKLNKWCEYKNTWSSQVQASQWHEMCCHDLEVMSSNPGLVEFGVRGTSVKSYLIQKLQLPVHQSIWKPLHLTWHKTSKIMWQYISFLEVTDCQVVDDSTFHVHLEQTSQWHEMYCRDLEVMSSNPGLVELGCIIPLS